MTDVLPKDLMRELAFFAKGKGRGVFGNYTPEVLGDYLAFHARHGSLRFVREGGEVTGLGIAWRLSRQWLFYRHAHHRPMFDWTPDDPDGTALFIGNVVTTGLPALRGLLQGLFERYPNWHQLPIFTYRKRGDRLVRLQPLAVARLFAGHEPKPLALKKGKE